ncbi:MAG: DUF5020 family protein [Paludibacter sp.]|jgi:opacity protein-like surface antigen|nr:DUF5020 family protein [Paludibacter sp.]
MRKFLFLMTVAVSTMTYAQTNLQLHYDFGAGRNYLTSTIERFKPDAKGSTFFFVDMNYNASGPTEAYFEIARELKFWDGPVSAHIEYNGGLHAESGMNFQINNAYLLGATYSMNSQDFSKGLSLSAMYKNIQGNASPHNFQLTAVWYMNMLKGKVSFTGFADFWKEKNGFLSTDYVFLSEPQLWYNINKTLSVGGEVELGYNFAGVAGFKACPTLAVKCNL